MPRPQCLIVPLMLMVLSIWPLLLPGIDALAYTRDTVLGQSDTYLYGEVAQQQSGNWTSISGDVNGDGFDDVLIGSASWSTTGINAGKTYLFLGKPGVPGTALNLSVADASFLGENPGDFSGDRVTHAGDVNGDGYDDILIGAFNNGDYGYGSGKVYLILGKPSGWQRDFSLANSDASFHGEHAYDQAGKGVAGAGDVNGDGFDDIIIGAFNNQETGQVTGKVYLIFGKPNGWSLDVNLSQADASFRGEVDYGWFGFTVAGIGDVNGDGYDDIAIGANYDSTAGGNPFTSKAAGQTFIVLGKPDGWARDVNISTVAAASYTGESAADLSGFSVAGAGDVNKDGFDDLLIGAVNNDDGGGISQDRTGAGQVYLILGKASGWGLLTNLSQADASFLGESQSNGAGWAVAGSGDVNGDSFDDIVVASVSNDEGGISAGQVYLILGKATGWTKDMDLASSDASFIGEAPFDFAGYSVSAGGDVNGDGYDDIMVSAPNCSKDSIHAGRSYLIFPDHATQPSSISSVKVFSDPGFTKEMTQAIVGQVVHIELRGSDDNSSRKDIAVVNVTSNASSRLGIQLRLYETGLSTGIYQGSLIVSSRSDEGLTMIKATPGEHVNITSVSDSSKKVSLFIGLDDLRVDGFSPLVSEVSRGQTIGLQITVRNAGLRDLLNVPVEVQASWIDSPADVFSVGNKDVTIKKGEAKEVLMDWDTTSALGNYSMKVIVDRPNRFVESNKSDNNATIQVKVLPQPADLALTVKDKYERGQYVQIRVRSTVGLTGAELQVLYPNGTLAFSAPVDLSPATSTDVPLLITPAYPLGVYAVRILHHGVSNMTGFQVVDQVPTISSPQDLEYFNGSTGNSINWTCTDIAPKGYNIKRNGTIIANGAWDGNPINIQVDGLQPGTYEFVLTINDTAGNKASDTVLVRVLTRANLGPVVIITNPAPGVRVTDIIRVQGTAEDPDGIVNLVEVRLGGQPWMKANGTGTWEIQLDTLVCPNGPCTIDVRAFDDRSSEGNASVTVLVDNNRPPLLTIDGPKANTILTLVVGVWGTASDPDGDEISIQVRIDGGSWIDTSGGENWRFEWDTTHIYNGNHTLTVKASDMKGAFSTSTINLTVHNSPNVAQTAQDPPVYANPVPVSVIALSGFSFVGVALLLTDIGRWAIFKLFFLAGYSKRKDLDLLDNFIRGWIQGVVVRDPGIRPVDVVEGFEGNYSTNLIYYHINELVRFGFIYMVYRNRRGEIVRIRKGVDGNIVETDHGSQSERETDLTLRQSRVVGMSIHLYPSDTVAPNSQINIRKKQRYMVYKFVSDHPGMNQTDIAESLDMARQTVAYHLKELQKDGFLIVGTGGKTKYYYIDTSTKADLRKDGSPEPSVSGSEWTDQKDSLEKQKSGSQSD